MAQLRFGTKGQIHFDSNDDFYEALGFLAKCDRTTSLHWEHNEEQGAWGSEGRIHCYKNLNTFPLYFQKAFTSGTGGILQRINCNDFVKYIVQNHGFRLGEAQDVARIKDTIPPAYLKDFDRGLNL